MNSGPGWEPLTNRNLSIAATGQRLDVVLPTANFTPFLNGSVFVISPARRKAKKQRVEAAQMSLVSQVWPCGTHTSLNWESIRGVIGNRCLFVPPFLASTLFTPLRTYPNWGISAVNGSPSPAPICIWRTAAR